MLQASLAQALARRQRYVTPGGAITHVSTYIGTNKMELLAQGQSAEQVAATLARQAMAYLVEQAPDAVVDPHFHEVDQFQLFIGGSGRIGTHRLNGVSVHYAGAHNPYGPIVAGPEGVQYMTLRHQWDRGAQWMPGAAQVLRDLPQRRHVTYTTAPLVWDADLGAQPGLRVTEVVPQQAHAGGVSCWQAGPGTVLQADPSGCAGQFWYLIGGSLLEPLAQGTGACIYFAPEEAPTSVRAGPQGVQLLQLRFALH